jgi:hypothetical protein
MELPCELLYARGLQRKLNGKTQGSGQRLDLCGGAHSFAGGVALYDEVLRTDADKEPLAQALKRVV